MAAGSTIRVLVAVGTMVPEIPDWVRIREGGVGDDPAGRADDHARHVEPVERVERRSDVGVAGRLASSAATICSSASATTARRAALDDLGGDEVELQRDVEHECRVDQRGALIVRWAGVCPCRRSDATVPSSAHVAIPPSTRSATDIDELRLLLARLRANLAP